MTRRGLSLARDALVTASACNIIDDDEFVFLYDAHSSKTVFPYWKFPKFDINTLSEEECYTEPRFSKEDLDQLLGCLGIPEKISCEQRTVCSGLEGLCILLR